MVGGLVLVYVHWFGSQEGLAHTYLYLGSSFTGRDSIYIYRFFFLLFLIRGKVLELLYVHVHKGERKGR